MILAGSARPPSRTGVDAPARIEMPQRMEARIFAPPACVHDPAATCAAPKRTHDVFMSDNPPAAGWEYEPERAWRASQAVFPDRY